jgi:hypothetical protein
VFKNWLLELWQFYLVTCGTWVIATTSKEVITNNLKIISFQFDIFYQDLMPGQQVFRAWSTTTGKSHSKVLENTDVHFFQQLKYLLGYQIFKTLAIHTLTGFFSQSEYLEYSLCHLALISSSPVIV